MDKFDEMAKDAVFSDKVGFASCGHCGGHSDLHGIVDLVSEALRRVDREAREDCARIGSKAAWLCFHEGDHSDWGFADAVSAAIRALKPTARR